MLVTVRGGGHILRVDVVDSSWLIPRINFSQPLITTMTTSAVTMDQYVVYNADYKVQIRNSTRLGATPLSRVASTSDTPTY